MILIQIIFGDRETIYKHLSFFLSTVGPHGITKLMTGIWVFETERNQDSNSGYFIYKLRVEFITWMDPMITYWSNLFNCYLFFLLVKSFSTPTPNKFTGITHTYGRDQNNIGKTIKNKPESIMWSLYPILGPLPRVAIVSYLYAQKLHYIIKTSHTN